MNKINLLDKKILFGFLALTYGSAWLLKPELKFFSDTEFGVWFPFVNNDVLLAIDKFRKLQGNAVFISPVTGAIGRLEGDTPDHNIIKGLGTSHALDVFPTIKTLFGYRPMNKKETKQAIENAQKAGFNAIGIYPDWTYSNTISNIKPQKWVGMHLGIRNNGDGFYSWSGYQNKEKQQVYASLDFGLNMV